MVNAIIYQRHSAIGDRSGAILKLERKLGVVIEDLIREQGNLDAYSADWMHWPNNSIIRGRFVISHGAESTVKLQIV